MTTAQFIAKTYATKNDKWGKYGYERQCSSVMTDRDGIVYSYGYHYPLAFKIAGLDFINEAGYSVTTGKHINWAREALGYGNYIGVKLNSDEASVIRSTYTSEAKKLVAIKQALVRELTEVTVQKSRKKRTDTQVYKHLEHEQARVIANTARVVAEARV